MNAIKTARKCCVCSKNLHGRSDKRYCSSDCKNEHHKCARKKIYDEFKSWQKTILRNHVVLEGIIGRSASRIRIKRQTLFKFGFDQFSITGTYKKENQRYFTIGKYHFTVTDNNKFEIFREKIPEMIEENFYKRWEVDFPEDYRNNLWDNTFERWDE